MLSALPVLRRLGAELIDRRELTFDPGDRRNGSLYLCVQRNTAAPFDGAQLLAEMRRAEIWSSQPERTVPEEHRQTYKDQLTLVDLVRYRGETGTDFIAARFDRCATPRV